MMAIDTKKKLIISDRVVYFTYAVLISFCYSPVIFSHYAFMDDYTTLYHSITGDGSTFQWDILSGRPSYAVLRLFYQGLMHNIEDFSYVRTFTVLSTILYSSMVYVFLKQKNIFDNKSIVLCLPVLLSINPAMLVYSAWATCFPFVISMIAALLAYQFLTTEKIKNIFLRFLISVCFIIFAFSIYQPTALTFLFYVFLDNCLPRRNINYRIVLLSAMVTLFGMISAYVMAKLMPVLLYGKILDRGDIVHDFGGKIYWFFHEAMINAINNFNILPNVVYTIISILFITVALLIILKGEHGVKKLTLAIILLIGSYAANLLVAENWAAFRGMIGLELILITCLVMGIFRCAELFPSVEHRYLSGVIVFLAIIAGQYNLNSGFVRQQQGEYQALSQAIVSSVDKNFSGNLYFDIRNPAFNIFTKVQRYDEFGNISLATSWSPAGMALSVKQTKGYNFNVSQRNAIAEDENCQNCIIIKTGDVMRSAGMYY